MCLTIKKGQRFLIVKTDIVCYKVLMERESELSTFFRHEIIKLKNTYYSKLSRHYFRYTDPIIEEALHSFVDYNSVKLFKVNQWTNPLQRVKIAKCIVPKGSKYIKGFFQKYEGYASDCLTYLEIVNE